ncbi:MAG: hypothetical protein J6V33_01105 [Bacteroidales bacterium]|nr:hypothetical protein [Bacteroidales bacterium]
MNTRKYTLLLASILLIFFNSCYKEGDLDALKNPIQVEIDPIIGAPLINTEIDIESLLELLGETQSYIKFGENDEVIITYSDSMQTLINTTSLTKSSIIGDTIEGELNIDIFEKIGMDSLQFSIGQVFLSLDCLSKSLFGQIPLLIRNLSFKMQRSDGSISEIYNIVELDINNIHQERTNILNKLSLSDLVNERPKKFFYSLEIEIDLSQVSTDILETLPDEIDLNFYFDLEVYLSGSTPGIFFQDTVNFDLGLNLDEIKIEDSKFILEITNKLPFEINIGLNFTDENHNKLCSFFNSENGNFTIESAQVDANGYVSKPKVNIVEVPFSSDKVELYNSAKHIEMSVYFYTANNGTQIVTVRKNDGLGLRLGAVVHPIVSTNLDLGLNF